MRTALLLVLALAAPGIFGSASASTVWKWVDDKGVTHYADRPFPGATQIELSSGTAVAVQAPAPSTPDPAADETAASANYRAFEIVQPKPDQAFINTAGKVDVQIRIEPGVRSSHALNLYLDGKRVEGFPRNAQSYTLSEVARGVHSVSAEVTDRNGNRVQETGAVSFVVRQESIAQPPVGPSQRPPPKPQPRAGNKMRTTQPSYNALNSGLPAIDPATNRPVVKKPAPKPGKP